MGEGNFKKNLAAFAIGLAVSCGVVGLTYIWIQHEPRKPGAGQFSLFQKDATGGGDDGANQRERDDHLPLQQKRQ